MIWLLACASALTTGERAWAEGDWAAVVEAWEGEALDPERTQRLARAYLRLERPEDASRTLARVAEAQYSATGWLVSGTLRAERGELPSAVADFEAGLALESMPELAVNLCLASLRLGEAATAARCAQATQLAPADPWAWAALAASGSGEVARRAGLTAAGMAGGDEALRAWLVELLSASGEYTAACALRAGDPLLLGQACIAAGRAAEAAEALTPIAARPEAAALLLRLAVDEAELADPGGPRELAIARAERWAAKVGDEPWAGLLVDLGRLSALNGDLATAEERWKAAMALAPGEPAPRLNLARVYWRSDRAPLARAVLSEGANLETPEGLSLSLALAVEDLHRIASSENEAAVEQVLVACRAANLSPCVAEAAMQLGLARSMRGDHAGAVAPLQEALLVGGEPVRIRLRNEVLAEAVRQALR